MKKDKIGYRNLAMIIYDEVTNKTVLEGIKNFAKDGSLLRDKNGNKLWEEPLEIDERHLEWESFYLWMFLITHCFQRKFVHLGDEKVRQILDFFHECIYSQRQKPLVPQEYLINVTNMFSIRYNQYYKVMKNDWSAMEQGTGEILFYDLSLVFVSNLTKKDLDPLKDFRMFRMKFGLYIAELIKTLFDIFEKIEKDYDVTFE